MFDREEDARDDGDASVKEEARRETIAEEKESAQRADHWLEIEDDVDDGGVSVLEREGEKDGADRGSGKAREEEVAPGGAVHFPKLAQCGPKNRQEHEQDEDVLPEDDDLRIEEIVQRNAPRAFRAPKSGAETDQPRSVGEAARRGLLHALRLNGRRSGGQSA